MRQVNQPLVKISIGRLGAKEIVKILEELLKVGEVPSIRGECQILCLNSQITFRIPKLSIKDMIRLLFYVDKELLVILVLQKTHLAMILRIILDIDSIHLYMAKRVQMPFYML